MAIDPAPSPADTASRVWDAVAGHLERFAEAWEAGDPPEVARFAPAGPPAVRRLALVELVKLDLKQRLSRGIGRALEEYLADLPELTAAGPPFDLLYEDYHLRLRAGQPVDPGDYYRRFPAAKNDLARLLGNSPVRSTSVFAAAAVVGVNPGDKLDDFDLLILLGKGQFARVFLARQRTMQRLVALKVSATRGAEAQTLARLDHPHIVHVFDQRALADPAVQLVYMTYVPGGTLQNLLEHVRGVPPAQRSGRTLLEAVDKALVARGELRPTGSSVRADWAARSWPATVCLLGAKLAAALDYAHRRGVLHRDIKPANVLLTADGEPLLADFNLGSCSKLDGAGPAVFFGGSLPYMAPEQLEAFNPAHSRSPESLDGRADIYSLAVTLWELWTGERPFGGEVLAGTWPATLDALVARRKAGPPAGMDTSEADVPDLREVLLRCLDPDPAHRPATAGELARELGLCLRPAMRVPTGPVPVAPAEPRRNPFVGPRALETGELLFGRDDEVVDLLNQLIADRVVLLYSVSGAGKTSLLKAGLVPGLRARGFAPLPVAQVRDERPAGLTGNRYRLSVFQRLEAGRPAADRLPVEQLDRLTLAAYLKDRVPRDAGAPVLVLDQFEDVLQIDPTDVDVKREFFEDLGAALRDTGLWAVISMREDHVAGLDPYLRHLPTRLRSRIRLGLLTDAPAREAVAGPAEAAGVPFHPDAAGQLVDQLRQVRVMQLDGEVETKPGLYVEPVQLQVVCQLIWDRLPVGATEITPAMLAGFSVDQALEQYYAVKVEAAAKAARVPERRVRRWVEDRLITELGLRGQVLRGHPDTAGLSNVAIESLEAAYLVRSEQRLGGTWYELTHDRLVDPIWRSNRLWRRQRLKRVMLPAAAGMVFGLLTLWLTTYYGLDTYYTGSINQQKTRIGTLETELQTQRDSLQAEIKDLEARKEALTRQANALKETNEKLFDDLAAKTTAPEVKGERIRPTVPTGSVAARLWTRGDSIRVGFLDGSPEDRVRVEQYAQGWTRFANVTFDFDTRLEQAQVRVSFSKPGVSYSLLGREALRSPRSEASTQLGAVVGATESEARRLTQHEFGHVLGLIHEYQNPNARIDWDYPAMIAYYKRLLAPGMPDQRIVAQFQPVPSDGLFGTKPFDPKSIMMFSIPRAVVKTGWTPEWGATNSELSGGDKKFVARLYPFDGPAAALPVEGLDRGASARTQRVQRLKLDRFQFQATKPGRYVVETKYAGPGLEVYLMGPGDEITEIKANDPKRPPESRVEADLQPGTYFIKVRHLKPTKAETYSIRVRYEGDPPMP